MGDEGLWLVTTLLDLAELLDERQSEAAYASALAARLADHLAPAQISLLIAGNAGDMTVAAASGGKINDLAGLQVRLNEGPCIDCHKTAGAVLNEAISGADQRWPRFASAGIAAGFDTVSALPMLRQGQVIGVLFSAAARAHQLSDADLRELKVVARTAAFAIARQRDLRRSVLAAEQLQRALDSRVVIEQAKGSVAARLGVSPDRAFELLRSYARQENLTLAEVSSRAVMNTLSPHDLMAAAQKNRGGHVRLARVHLTPDRPPPSE
jgi:hypothetical protein